MRRILIHSLIFSPDGDSTAYLYNDIALRLQERGYEVVVLTTVPHFNIVPEYVAQQPLHWKVWGLCKVSCFHGMTVLHVPQRKFRWTPLRLMGFLYWHIVSFFIGLCIRHVDLILSPSPPLTIGMLNLWLAKLKGCKVVYNVQEIYPDILKLKGGLVLRFLKWMERKVYDGSDAVTTIDPVFYDTIAPRFKDRNKLHIIPNFVDTELYRQVSVKFSVDRLELKVDSLEFRDSSGVESSGVESGEGDRLELKVDSLESVQEVQSNRVQDVSPESSKSDENLTKNPSNSKLSTDSKLYTLNSELFPNTDSIKLLYAGNIGLAQSWEPLMALAERTRDMDVEYIVMGEGARRGYVAAEIEKRGLEKVRLLPYLPRTLMPAVLSYADVSFIFMNPEMDGEGFPSKVYTIMACQRPMLILSGGHTPMVNFLRDKGCAKLVTERDFERKVDEMVGWLRDVTKEELREMGRKGLAEIQAKYTKEKVTDQYVELVRGLVGG